MIIIQNKYILTKLKTELHLKLRLVIILNEITKKHEKKRAKDKNSKNVLNLKITEVLLLVHCNVVNNKI